MSRRFIPPEAKTQVWSLFDSETQETLVKGYTDQINALVVALGGLVEALGGEVNTLAEMDRLLSCRKMSELGEIAVRLAELKRALHGGVSEGVPMPIPSPEPEGEERAASRPAEATTEVSTPPASTSAPPSRRAGRSTSFAELSAESNSGRSFIRVRFLKRIYPDKEAGEQIEQMSDAGRAQLLNSLLDIYEQQVGGRKAGQPTMKRLRRWAGGLETDQEVVGEVTRAPQFVRSRTGVVNGLMTQVGREVLDEALRAAVEADAQERSPAALATSTDRDGEEEPAAKVMTPEERLPGLHREFLQFIYEGDDTLCGLVAEMNDQQAARLIERLIEIYDENITNERERASQEQLARLRAWAGGTPDRRIAERVDISQTNITNGRMGIAERLRQNVSLEVLEQAIGEVISEEKSISEGLNSANQKDMSKVLSTDAKKYEKFLAVIYGPEAIADMTGEQMSELIVRLVKWYPEAMSGPGRRATPGQLERVQHWAEGQPTGAIAEAAGVTPQSVSTGRMLIAERLRDDGDRAYLDQLRQAVLQGVFAISSSEDNSSSSSGGGAGGTKRDDGPGESERGSEVQSGEEKKDEAEDIDEIVKQFAGWYGLSDDQAAALSERLDPGVRQADATVAREAHNELISQLRGKWRQISFKLSGDLTPLQQTVMDRFLGIKGFSAPQFSQAIAILLRRELEGTDITAEFATILKMMMQHGD